jgi:cytochrome c oxidase subunit IV
MSAAAHALSHAELLEQENRRYHAFINLALFLSVFTGVEIVVIFLPLPSWVLMTTLVTLSIVKFFCVIFWFMHLIYDAPLLTILFLAGLILAAGTMIALLGLLQHDDVDPAILHESLAPPPAAAPGVVAYIAEA